MEKMGKRAGGLSVFPRRGTASTRRGGPESEGGGKRLLENITILIVERGEEWEKRSGQGEVLKEVAPRQEKR